MPLYTHISSNHNFTWMVALPLPSCSIEYNNKLDEYELSYATTSDGFAQSLHDGPFLYIFAQRRNHIFSSWYRSQRTLAETCPSAHCTERIANVPTQLCRATSSDWKTFRSVATLQPWGGK